MQHNNLHNSKYTQMNLISYIDIHSEIEFQAHKYDNSVSLSPFKLIYRVFIEYCVIFQEVSIFCDPSCNSTGLLGWTKNGKPI